MIIPFIYIFFIDFLAGELRPPPPASRNFLPFPNVQINPIPQGVEIKNLLWSQHYFEGFPMVKFLNPFPHKRENLHIIWSSNSFQAYQGWSTNGVDIFRGEWNFRWSVCCFWQQYWGTLQVFLTPSLIWYLYGIYIVISYLVSG